MDASFEDADQLLINIVWWDFFKSALDLRDAHADSNLRYVGPYFDMASAKITIGTQNLLKIHHPKLDSLL